MARKVNLGNVTDTNPYNFTNRVYQLPALRAFHNGVRNLDLVWHRRAGKDKTCISLNARAMVPENPKDELGRIGGYYYVFPEFNQGRKALWDNLDNDGFRTLKHINPKLWDSENGQQMKLTLKNGSYLQVVGSDNVDSIVGSNPLGLTFSEWSLQDPKVLGYLDPIIRGNGGFKIFNYTPRGNNHAKKFHEDAMKDDRYFSQVLTVEDTGLFTKKELKEIQEDYIRRYGDDSLFQQEYYCSFETPPQGAYYVTQINQLKKEGRLTKVKYDSNLMVYTVWDLGASDTTPIIFYQKPSADRINIIDYYETYGRGMEHFRDVLNAKPYDYAVHYLPHDGRNKLQSRSDEVETRASILEDMVLKKELKGRVEIVDRQGKFGVMDGMSKAKSLFHKIFIDEENCERLILCLSNYRTEWSEKNMIWGTNPVHDWASHACLHGDSLIKTEKGDKKIKDIKVGEKVWTPMGYHKVLNAGMTKISKKIITIETDDGNILKCTPEHKIFTDKGVVRADALRYNDIIWKKIDPSKLNFKEQPTNFRDAIMLHPQVYGKSIATYIEQFGHSIMERFQKVTMSTTKTGTPLIMTFPTWIVSQPMNIYPSTQGKATGSGAMQIEDSSLKPQFQNQKNGTNLKRVENGTVSMGKKPGIIINKLQKIVNFVGKSIQHLFLQDQDSVTRIVKLIIEDLNLPVYDLTVDKHHCYLANSLLVSNSDAFRYLAISYEEPFNYEDVEDTREIDITTW